MRARTLARWLSAVTAAGFLVTALAGPPALDQLDSRGWLARIHDAVARGNYTGTLVSTVGGAVSSSRIAHYCEGRQQFERVEMLDGEARQVYRHNDLVYTLWPARRVAMAEQRDAANALPSLLSVRPDDRLFESYELRAEGSGRVAGHETLVFLLRPRDDARFAQRLWAERSSGLPLRTEVLAPDGSVLEGAAFSDVTIGVRPQPESVLKPMKKLDGYRVLRPDLAAAQLEDDGWQLVPVAGFRQVSCVRRTVGGSAPDDAETVSVLQAVYSDGLTHVSVFIEPFREGRHRAGKTALGATHTLMRRHDQWWITVMGDVPMATVLRFADALQRRR